jgi:hypothetical protein
MNENGEIIYKRYLKTHNKTGLKYLGKTIKEDAHKYKDSGKYWVLHIKKHGYDVTTDILFETQSEDELEEKGLYYSDLWDVVNNPDFANLGKENGNGGPIGRNVSSETRKK